MRVSLLTSPPLPSVPSPQQKPNSADGEGTQRLCLCRKKEEDQRWDVGLAALPGCSLVPWLRCCGCFPGTEPGSALVLLALCSGLTLAECQVPTKAALSLPLHNWTGGENKTKGSWIEIRTGRSFTNYRHGQNRLDLGKN